MAVHTTRIRACRGVAIAAACLAGLVLTPVIAQAGVNAGTSIAFPSSVTVGDTGVPASIELRNENTPPNSGDTNIICDAGAPPCPGERGVVLVPSCGQLDAGFQCAASGADPGVFRLSTTGVGTPGTSCAGIAFNIAVIEQTFGTVGFTALAPGPVVLPGTGSSCVIAFTFDVLKIPSRDQNPARAGIQTVQTTEHEQFDPFGPGVLALTRATSGGTTVAPAPAKCAGRTATLVAGPGQTVISGTPGPDVIVGGDAGETIEGRGGDDTICSGKGDDTVRGGTGNDSIRGQDGKDKLFGDSGDDLLLGGTGNDDLRAGTGNDRTGGGDGADRIDGGSGDDLLDDQALGGKGRDRLLGGTGTDRVRAADRSTDAIDCGSDRDSVLMDTRDRQTRCERVRRS